MAVFCYITTVKSLQQHYKLYVGTEKLNVNNSLYE